MTKSAIIRVRAIERASADEQLRFLRALRRDVIARLVGATSFRQFQLSQVLGEIDRLIDAGRSLANDAAGAAVRRAWEAGTKGVDAVLRRAGVELEQSIFGLSQRLLSAVVDVTTDQTRAVWSELGRRLKTEVRRAALGIEDPFEAMTAIARRIKDPKSFGTAEVRAEVIIRTEVGRTFETAGHRRAEEADERLDKVGQRVYHWWLNVHDARTRPAHEAAGRAYSERKAIPLDEPFIVDGEELKHPLDPNGSASNVANCRCTEMLVVRNA